MALFSSQRRPMGGFLPPRPEDLAMRDEGVTETLRNVEALGRLILRSLNRLEKKMANQDVTVQDILNAVQAQSTAIGSLQTLIGGIKERLNAALKDQISPEAQATLNQIMAEVQGNSRKIADAIATNDDDPTTIASDGSGGPVAGADAGTGAASGSVDQQPTSPTPAPDAPASGDEAPAPASVEPSPAT